MDEEIEELLTKAEGENKEEALEAMIMLSKVYAYGFYGAKKDLEKAEFWSKKAIELRQLLPKNTSAPYDIFKRAREFKKNVSGKQDIKIDKTFTTRFDNIQNNLKFINKKDNLDDTLLPTNRFDNIQRNFKFISKKTDTR